MFLVKWEYGLEKINLTNNSNSLISKPDWLRVKAPQVERIGNTANLLNDLNLNTVLLLVDETVILCKLYIELGCF